MPSLGPMEIMVVSVLALIVFGPDKLPEIARTVGGLIKQMRAMADDVKHEFSDGFEVEDEPDDEEAAALAQDDTEVARLDDEGDSTAAQADTEVARLDDEGDSTAAPDDKNRPASRPDGHSEHPVAGAIKAEREASGPSEGA